MSVNKVDIYIGTQIKFRRQELGITQIAIGKELGITFQQVQKYENGLNRIGSGRLWDISKILNVPITYFYDGFEITEEATKNKEYPKELEKQILKVIKSFVKIKNDKMRKMAIQFIKNLCKQFN